MNESIDLKAESGLDSITPLTPSTANSSVVSSLLDDKFVFSNQVQAWYSTCELNQFYRNMNPSGHWLLYYDPNEDAYNMVPKDSVDFEKSTHDPVDHPTHYADVVPGVECIEITRHCSFNRGNAIKYIWRNAHKNNAIEDLKKAIWYIEDEISSYPNNFQLSTIVEDKFVAKATKFFAEEGFVNTAQALNYLTLPALNDAVVTYLRLAAYFLYRQIAELEKL